MAKTVQEQQDKIANHKNEVLNLNLKYSQMANQLQLQTDHNERQKLIYDQEMDKKT